MSPIRIIIVAFVAILILGGASLGVYKLYVQPQAALRAEQKKIAAEEAEKAAAPDPAEVAFAELKQQLQNATPETTLSRGNAFIEKFPTSPHVAEIRSILGPLNIAALYKPEGENRVVHTVAKGDSLYKISRKNKATIELIARANNLTNTMLQIGQELLVPQSQITATIDREAKTLRLDNAGNFLIEYPLLSANAPSVRPGDAKVADAVVENNGKRLTFGQKGYTEGTRSLILSIPGATITGVAADTPNDKLPAGFVVKNDDMSDIFVLLTRGISVTIK